MIKRLDRIILRDVLLLAIVCALGLTFLFTALRFGFSVGWKVTLLTEVFSSNEGIGFEMRVASQLFRMDELFAWAISFFIFALILEKLVLQRSERKFFRWRAEATS